MDKNIEESTIEENVVKLLHYENHFYLILDLIGLEHYVTIRKKVIKE